MFRLKHLVICFIINTVEKELDLSLILRIFSKCSEKLFLGGSFQLVEKQLFMRDPKKNFSAMDCIIVINLHVKSTTSLKLYYKTGYFLEKLSELFFQ